MQRGVFGSYGNKTGVFSAESVGAEVDARVFVFEDVNDLRLGAT